MFGILSLVDWPACRMTLLVITDYGNHESRLKFSIRPNWAVRPFGSRSSCFVDYQKNNMYFVCEDIECLFNSFPDLDKRSESNIRNGQNHFPRQLMATKASI